MSDDAEAGAVPAPPTTDGAGGATAGVPGWYPDPWSSTRQRWWTGHTWTFSTSDTGPEAPAQVSPPADDPPPDEPPAEVMAADTVPDEAPPPALPPPPRPSSILPASSPAPEPEPSRLAGARPVVLVVLVGLVLGVLGGWLLHRSNRPKGDTGGAAAGQGPGAGTPPAADPGAATANNDPSAAALATVIVRQADVASPPRTVGLLPGGVGLSQPTLDLCNGNYPSELRRTARLQNVVVDEAAGLTFSTEAVLYADPGAAAQAFSELKAVTAACPATPVAGPVGDPTVITRFNPPPDGGWPQTATVNRMAFDFTTTDETGQTRHSIAVYLQRGRALLGVYFSQPDGPQAPVAGQTTLPGIVGVFAGRLAALPASVTNP